MRRTITHLVDVAVVLCVLLALVSIFSDGLSLYIGRSVLEYRSLRLPLYVLTGLGVLGAWTNRRRLQAFLQTPAPDGRQRNAGGTALWTLIAIGFVLRIARVYEYGLNPDEGQFLYVALSRTWSDLWHYATVESPHPVANVALLHLITRVSRSLLWLRLPSVLGGTFLIWISHRFALELFGRGAGLAMATLVTFSPALIDLSRVCRNYAPGLAVLLVALWLFVRFLRDGRWRDFRLFALAELLAVSWVFSFVVVFAALNLTLVIAFLRQRAGLGSWMRAALFQLPVAAVLSFLYLYQVAHLPPDIVAFHHMIYAKESVFSAEAPLLPLKGLWEYLGPSALVGALLWLSLLGLVCLVVKGEREKAFLCASPILLGYAAVWAGQLPLGNTRHGVFLFPFLFALVASQVPEMLQGYAPTWSALQRGSRLKWAAGTGRVAPLVGAVLLVVAAGAYVDASLLEYDKAAVFEPLDMGRGRELLRYYRQEDVDRGFALLEQRAGPDDIVMMSVAGIIVLRAHLATCQTREEEAHDIRWEFPPRGPFRYSHKGINFYMSPEGGIMFSSESFVRAVRHVQATYGLPDPPRVWAIQSAKEIVVTDAFRRRYPGAAVDLEVSRASNGWVFAIDGRGLTR